MYTYTHVHTQNTRIYIKETVIHLVHETIIMINVVVRTSCVVENVVQNIL